MITGLLAAAPAAILATAIDRVPGIFFGLPLVLVAAIVFAATHHEDPRAIRGAALQWIGWLAGVLGAVLAAVSIVGWFA